MSRDDGGQKQCGQRSCVVHQRGWLSFVPSCDAQTPTLFLAWTFKDKHLLMFNAEDPTHLKAEGHVQPAWHKQDKNTKT